MLKIAKDFFELHNLFNKGATGIVAGVSGGADSVALLFALLEIREEMGIGAIFAAHVNHNLRGEESKRDELFVQELCNKHNIPLKIDRLNMPKFSEETARNLRYKCLEQARREFSADYIATAHNMDDNTETILMNLCRGAGLKGLCGIPPVNGAIIRPLLDAPRADIEEYLRVKQIDFITDTSNLSNDYTRNRLRNEIIPMLEKQISTGARTAPARNAKYLREDENFLESAALEAFEKCAENKGLNIKKLLALPPALSRRVIRFAITRENKDAKLCNISCAHVSAVLNLACGAENSGKELHLPGVIVMREYEFFLFLPQPEPEIIKHTDYNSTDCKRTDYNSTDYKRTDYNSTDYNSTDCNSTNYNSQGFFYQLEKNASAYIPEIHKTIILSDLPPPQGAEMRQILCTKAFDYDKITKPLVFRTRRPGDKITLKTKSGKFFTKKLQDIFTDEKIPKSKRDEIPVLAHNDVPAHGDEILWIFLGVYGNSNRVNAKFQASEETRNKLWMSLEESVLPRRNGGKCEK
ncbi:MAG: tRNA lysidine(34) synthetase TilS [Defluviitaleaceae bacterium]|nr:tRNA lysidine(34) synthetase TilS [Defluviitaleaceae bacterium]